MVLALSVLAHFVPAFWAIGGAVVLTLFELLPRAIPAARRRRLEPDDTDRDEHSPPSPIGASQWSSLLSWGRSRLQSPGVPPQSCPQVLWWTGSTVGLGLLLSGWWLVPFGIRLPYSTSLRYQNVTTYVHILFPEADLWALVLAASLWCSPAPLRRSRFGLFIAVMGGLSAGALILDPQGSLYNVRLLPLWFLCVYLMVGWGFAVSCNLVALRWRQRRSMLWSWRFADAVLNHRPLPPRPRVAPWAPGAVWGALLAVFGALLVVIPPFFVPAGALPVSAGSPMSSWAGWNYSGVEGKPAYPEYRGLMATMGRMGHRYGCGRAMWEYGPSLDRFGTPMALMLLPYWTNGCIDSMEGLLFESSATTPYHFINQAELSAQPSEAVVGLPYGGVNVALGIEHLQLLGVRYFMASSPSVEQYAKADPSLHLIATSGPWHSPGYVATTWDIFEVMDAPIVVPLSNEPAVLTESASRPIQLARPLGFLVRRPSTLERRARVVGTDSWPRVRTDDIHPPAVSVAKARVSDVRTSNNTISFRVSRLGTPVLVKVSYFPNWQASGATGPWRVTPNLMVVVPTSHQVTMTYGATHANELGEACFVVGLGVLLTMATVGVVRRRRQISGRPSVEHQ